MIKGLLALDENLASSIALRYASIMVETLPMQLQVGHVELPNDKTNSAGSERIRSTWKSELKKSGRQAIQRLLNTEKVACPFVGIPKVFIGNKDESFLQELNDGRYDLFLEGNLNTSDITEFYKLISSKLYSKTPCPILVIKNLTQGNRVALLCGDGVNHKTVISKTLELISEDKFIFNLVYYRYQDNKSTVIMPKEEAGSTLMEAEELLKAENRKVGSSHVLCGTPEHTAEALSKYWVVASSFPVQKSPRLQLLAHCPSPILLCN